MIKQIFFMLLTIAIVVGCIFLPYMPGEYDSFAVQLSTITQLAAIAALFWVPLGIAWWWYKARTKQYAETFAKIFIVIAVVVLMAAALGAFISHSISLMIIILAMAACILTRLIVRRKFMKPLQEKRPPFAMYIVIVPLGVLGCCWCFRQKAVHYSTARVIRQSEVLISDIEQYYSKNGRYPVSLLSLWEDYKPGVKGIGRYHYELKGKAYNLFFEQYSHQLSVREIVMYNKLDEHEMTSHNQDLLLLDDAALNVQRGYFTSRPLQIPHWKYFRFD